MVTDHPDLSFAREFEVALEAASEASSILLGHRGRVKRIDTKGSKELVSEADRAAEAAIRSTIARHFPEDRFLGEESNEVNHEGHSLRVWHVDPLDGTTNYIKGLALWCISIALCDEEGMVQVAVVNAPLLEETYAAKRGSGAALNGSSIHCSSVATVESSLIGSGFPYSTLRGTNQGAWERVTSAALATRCHGASALDLCFVGAGRLDGFWEHSLGTWDTAAGILIASEAGARVTDFAGIDLRSPATDVVAANPLIHATLLDLVNSPAS